MTSRRLRSAPSILSVCLAAAVSAAACGGEKVDNAGAAAPATAEAQRVACNALVAQLQRQADDADRRSREADQRELATRAQCQLTQHEFDSLRERDAFEDSIWSRLDHVAIDEAPVREKLARAPRGKRQALEATLADADQARRAVQQALRRVRQVPDVEWPRYRHDVESTVDGVDRMLRAAQ